MKGVSTNLAELRGRLLDVEPDEEMSAVVLTAMTVAYLVALYGPFVYTLLFWSYSVGAWIGEGIGHLLYS